MIKVYIASPYTKGNKEENVKFQITIGDYLINEGYAPFIPLLSHYQHIICPLSYDKWLELDFEWIKSCNCLLRLQGISKGADLEVEFAKKNNIKVFYSITDLCNFYKEGVCNE